MPKPYHTPRSERDDAKGRIAEREQITEMTCPGCVGLYGDDAVSCARCGGTRIVRRRPDGSVVQEELRDRFAHHRELAHEGEPYDGRFGPVGSCDSPFCGCNREHAITAFDAYIDAWVAQGRGSRGGY